MKVLLVEDDKRISDFIRQGLEEKGFLVKHVSSSEQARDLLSETDWDILLLDIMLPGIDGVELVKMARYRGNTMPIIALSALSLPEDKIRALDSGADDYITKPFHFDELLSRINALHRRVNRTFADSSEVLTVADLSVDLSTKRVTRDGKAIELSAKEFNLLTYLLRNVNRVMSRTQILNAVWGINYATGTNVVDVYISYLRTKIDRQNEESLISTVKGFGYTINTER